MLLCLLIHMVLIFMVSLTTFCSLFTGTGTAKKVPVETMRPLPVQQPSTRKQATRSKPPSCVYTTPICLDYIKTRDKNVDENFDVALVKKKAPSKASKKVPPKAAQKAPAPPKAAQKAPAPPKAAQKASSKAAPKRKGPTKKTTPKIKSQRLLEQSRDSFAETMDLLTAELSAEDRVEIADPCEGEVGQEGRQLPILPGRTGFRCCICDITHGIGEDLLEDDDEDHWIFCPRCHVMSHVTCIRVKKCICGFKPLKKHIRI